MPLPILAAKVGGRLIAKQGAKMIARRGARMAAQRGGRMAAQRGFQMARSPQMRSMASRGMRYARSPQALQNMQQMQSMRNTMGGNNNNNNYNYNNNVRMRSMAKGGKVMKTGLVYLHKGERVVPVNVVNKVEKGLRNMGINLRLPKANNTVKVAANKLRKLSLRSMTKGGKVVKTGPHKVAKGQRVIPTNKVSNVDKILRRK